MGYREDVTIDINNLDVELIRQAGLFQHWGRQEASSLYEKDQIEESLHKCRARLDLAIRSEPEKFGFTGKLTEGAINSIITLHPDIEIATEAFFKSKYKTKVLGIAVKSFEHKKKALEKLADLYINGYWATPKVDPEAQRAFDEQAQEIVSKTMKGDKRMLALAKKKEAKRLADVEAERRAAAARRKTAVEKKNAGGKTKSEPKPIGKTEEQIRPKPKRVGKKKK
jgi:hypothetical protein